MSIFWKEMEVKYDNTLKHRPLTPFRVVRGLTCLVVFLSTAFLFLVYFGPPAAVMLRFLSLHHSRKTTSFFFALWLSLWPFLFEKINGTKVVFSGDSLPVRERVLLIANHRTEVDWMYLWNLALRKGCLGHIKYILKSSLMKLPVLGWGFHILEFVPLERKWEVDEPVMRHKLSSFTDPQDSLWLALFPEGTDFKYCAVIPFCPPLYSMCMHFSLLQVEDKLVERPPNSLFGHSYINFFFFFSFYQLPFF